MLQFTVMLQMGALQHCKSLSALQTWWDAVISYEHIFLQGDRQRCMEKMKGTAFGVTLQTIERMEQRDPDTPYSPGKFVKKRLTA